MLALDLDVKQWLSRYSLLLPFNVDLTIVNYNASYMTVVLWSFVEEVG